jgi:leucyl-tRNA synthetase
MEPALAGEYSADATRLALADASDSNDDGNFEESSANAAVLRLTKELAWIKESMQARRPGCCICGHRLTIRAPAASLLHG